VTQHYTFLAQNSNFRFELFSFIIFSMRREVIICAIPWQKSGRLEHDSATKNSQKIKILQNFLKFPKIWKSKKSKKKLIFKNVFKLGLGDLGWPAHSDPTFEHSTDCTTLDTYDFIIISRAVAGYYCWKQALFSKEKNFYRMGTGCAMDYAGKYCWCF
jgi:hypothetical protein